MNDFKIQDFLGKTISCKCGREHSVDIDKIIIQKNAITLLPQIIKEYKFKRVFMIADNNTYKVQGSEVERLLIKNDIQFNKCIFNSERQLIPNEKAIVEALLEFEKGTDLIIGVGTGTINDISRFLSFKVDIPYFIIATAPSMDGFASTVSPLIINSLKTTYEARGPKVIMGDIEVLKNAPMDMILAGLGDVIGKYTSLCDWKLGQIINNEYYCDFIVDMVRDSIKKCIDNIDGIKNREEDAIKNLVEGLIITGIAMSFSGNSRPASGAEHHLAHFWEMMFLFDDKEAVLHGRKVGVTEIVVAKLYELLTEVHFDYDKAINKANKFSEDKWENDIKTIYRSAAGGIIESNKKEDRNSKEKYIERLNNIQKKWSEIISSVKELVPMSNKIQSVLKEAGAPINPKQIGVSSEMVLSSLIYGKEIRTRYTILQLLWDIGILDELSQKVRHYFDYEQEYGNYNPELENKNEMLRNIKCFVLDMDGTFYLGDKIIDGSLDFLDLINKTNKSYHFYTNNSSRNIKFYIEKLTRMGCNIANVSVLNSTQVILKYLDENNFGKKVYLVGNEYLKEDFINAGYVIVDNNPELVVVGFDTTLNYEKLTKACTYTRNGIPIFAVNPDFNCPVEDGFIPDCGSICAAIKASTGVTPMYFGKPSKYTLNYILDITGFKENEIAFVGDRLYTDIAIGKGTKVVTILVLSGETKIEDLETSDIKPDLIFKSLLDVKEKLENL